MRAIMRCGVVVLMVRGSRCFFGRMSDGVVLERCGVLLEKMQGRVGWVQGGADVEQVERDEEADWVSREPFGEP